MLQEQVRNRWLNRIFGVRGEIDKVRLVKGVNFLYQLAGLKSPEIVYAQSPMGCVLCDSIVSRLLRSDSVWASVKDSVRASVWASVSDSVKVMSLCGNIGDYGWVAFFNYFEEIGVLKHRGFRKFRSLLESNVYDMTQRNGVVCVCGMPVLLERDDRGRLHSEVGMAIQWPDGWGVYALNGVRLSEKL